MDPTQTIIDIVVFDGAYNVQLGGKRFKFNYPKLTVMCGVEHTLSSFLNDLSKIAIVNKMVPTHKSIHKNLVLVFIIILVPYSNKNNMNFETGTLVFLVLMIPEWMDIYGHVQILAHEKSTSIQNCFYRIQQYDH